jgi:hypothetical protein
MSQIIEQSPESTEPVGQISIVYLGPIEPHWDIQTHWGDETALEALRERIIARLVLLPPHDPQFRRNRERINRDGEREAITVTWDLGYPEEAAAEA